MPNPHTETRSETTPEQRTTALQLDLFAPSETVQDTPRGMTPSVARAAVSPGWWPMIARFFHPAADVIVTRCQEVDGTLDFEVMPLTHQEPADPVTRWPCEAARHTCGCCGVGEAKPFRDFGQPTRVVCPRCRERLLAGETYLGLVDRFFTLDGKRRDPPLAASETPAERSETRAPVSRLRPCTTLPPDELRQLVRSVRTAMQSIIVGQDDAVAALALLGSLHVGGGLSRGARALIMGPSGSAKSTSVSALRAALSDWDVAWVTTNAVDLSSPGWSGAPSIGDLIGDALNGTDPDSLRARRAVVVVDELHHAGVVPGLEGNMRAKRSEVLASLLALFGDGTVHLSGGTKEWASREALVLGLGVFPRALAAGRLPTNADLELDGLPLELASRMEQIIRLERLPEYQLVHLLHRWPALRDLTDICVRLGYTVRLTDEAVRHAARVVTLGGDALTARNAGAWLVAALRHSLINALADPDQTELVITPDSLPIPPHATHEPPEDPPNEDQGRDKLPRR